MDQFGVLVERYGFKPHGNSAPLAQLKSNNPPNPPIVNTNNNGNGGFPQNIGGGGGMPADDFLVGDLDDIFYTHNNKVGDLDDIFYTHNNKTATPAASTTTTTHIPSILDDTPESLFPFTIPNSTSEPDLQHNHHGSNAADDLIPGFGITTPRVSSDVKVSQPPSNLADDSFLVFETPAWLQPNTGNVPVQNSIDDELERLGRATKINKEETVKKSNTDNIIGMGTPTTSISKPISRKKEPVFDRSFPAAQKPASSTYVPKDFISLFEDDVNTSGAFKERDGESDEQRRRRLNSHTRTQDRMAQALAEKQQRDLRIHQEQEERSRLAGTLDNKIKRWASGKEGNLRALLSSLQDVLWGESGWQTASITEMMESRSVKKVYYRATLYLHPDKVQQKGLSPQEKYIAEKVFNVLKEAYKVFEAQELR